MFSRSFIFGTLMDFPLAQRPKENDLYSVLKLQLRGEHVRYDSNLEAFFLLMRSKKYDTKICSYAGDGAGVMHRRSYRTPLRYHKDFPRE
jgi:hypothetical protein